MNPDGLKQILVRLKDMQKAFAKAHKTISSNIEAMGTPQTPMYKRYKDKLQSRLDLLDNCTKDLDDVISAINGFRDGIVKEGKYLNFELPTSVLHPMVSDLPVYKKDIRFAIARMEYPQWITANDADLKKLTDCCVQLKHIQASLDTIAGIEQYNK